MASKYKGPDKLAKDAAAAKAANMSYGNWKAMQTNPVKTKNEIPDGWKVCQYCGKPYKPKTKRPQLYCEVYCGYMASKEREHLKRQAEK